MRPRRFSEASQRFADRREREDSAPRLVAVVPRLLTLNLHVSERRAEGRNADTSYVRRIVVGSAPALFALGCGDTSCKDGGHDLTYAILRALEAGKTAFEGDDTCQGSLGSASCGRVLHYVAEATYSPPVELPKY